MALKAVVESLEGIPEHFHELYTERNGKFELTGVEGMRTQADVDRLTTSLAKERTDHKSTKEKYAPLSAFDISDVLAKLDRFEELEAAAEGKLDDNKINSLVESRLRSRVAPIERERDQLKSQVAEKETVISTYKAKERQSTISSAVTAAARKAGLQESAIEDAVLLAERVFDIDEGGQVSAKDNVGCTPGIDPAVWFTEMQSKRPHWWGASQGGGASGNRGNGGGANSNPFTNENWNMTEQGRIFRENPQRAEQLAKSAGTKVGGPRPAAKSK